MSSMGKVGTVSSFHGREYDVFYWKIDEFSMLSEKEECFYESPDITFKDEIKHLIFYPNTTSDPPSEGYFALYFGTPKKQPSNQSSRFTSGSTSATTINVVCPWRIHLTLGLKTRGGRIEKWFSRFILSSEQGAFGSPAMIRRSEFLKRKEELAPSDCLTFVVFLSPEAVEYIRDVADQIENGHVKENGEEEKKGSEKVLDDIAKMWDSGNKSDTTIFVEGVEFKVHSCILAARSDVFAAMFEHDTLEKKTSKVIINDCEPAVFKEFLNHLYTGSVQDLTVKNAFSLYLVADKYQVKDLKEVCRLYIGDNLSLETFCEAVQLAQRCADKDLMESATDYFATKYRLIIRSDRWKQYLKEDPIQANEILIKFFGPL